MKTFLLKLLAFKLKEYCTFFTIYGRSVNNIFRRSHWEGLAKYVFWKYKQNL